MGKIRVGILRGGTSGEYDVSLKSGGAILRHIPRNIFDPVDVLLDKEGVWHLDGFRASPEKVGSVVDVVWNALHGFYGEDGKVQTLLDSLFIPYTGSRAFASAAGMNKAIAKTYFRNAGIKTPRFMLLEHWKKHRPSGWEDDYIAELPYRVVRSFSPPWVIKPLCGGSSLGIRIARHFNDLDSMIREEMAAQTEDVFVEEFVRGREATVAVIDDFRGKPRYALPPIEVVNKKGGEIWDYEAKYDDNFHDIVCPGRFSKEEKKALRDMAIKIHSCMNLRHYSRSDFIVAPHGVYALEVNTLPGTTESSLLPAALPAVGITMPEFITHTLMLALKR
ncbi:ATP-grasp domain-containing protein [bacterium]|nr:ATP-grasp domain-containing protein [bacterium]MCI0566239.1 ATP-grasp domain-containing protein [bacterium]MCI0680197.1 ATP-grasp domain-containing protein [bacterium]